MAQCHQCDMVYLKKAPDISELFKNLAWEKTTLIEEKKRDKESAWLRKISKLTRKRMSLLPRKQIDKLVKKYVSDGNVLDVGSGPGSHILNLPETYTPFGIEISEELANQGRANFQNRKGDIINLDALNGLKTFPENMFSAIIMRSFLEHDVTPLPVLEECFRTSKKGGVVIIKVPNYASLNRKIRGKKWCGLRLPDHVNYFTPATLEKMVLKSGLSIHHFGFLDCLPTSDNMWLIACKK